MPRRAGARVIIAFGLAALLGAAPPQRVDLHGDPLPPGALARFGTVRLWHEGVDQLAFTNNGARLVSVSGSPLDVRMWDTATGHLLTRRKLATKDQMPALIGPDGGVFIADHDSVRYLKDLDSLEKTIFEEEGVRISRVHPSPDGKRLAIGCLGGGVLLDVREGKIVMPLEGVTKEGAAGRANDFAFSRDGKLLACTYTRGQLNLWDTEKRKLLHAVPAPRGEPLGASEVSGLSFSPDGRYLLFKGGERLRMLETATGKEVSSFQPLPDRLDLVRFNRDGKQLVGLDTQGQFHRLDAATGRGVSMDPLPFLDRRQARTVAVSSDHSWAAVAQRSSIHLIDLSTGQLAIPRLGNRAPLTSVFWSSGNEVVSVTSGRDEKVLRWDPATGKPVSTHDFGEGVVIQGVDPNGELSLGQSWDGPWRVVRLADGKELWKADEFEASAPGSFTPDGRWVVSGDTNVVRVRDARTGKLVWSWKLDPETSIFTSLAWSRCCRMFATIEVDDKVTIREARTGQPRFTFASPLAATARFSPDGLHLAVESSDGVIRVYKVGRARPVFEVVVRLGSGRPHDVEAGPVLFGMDTFPILAFSPDGQRLAAACRRDVRVWDLTGRPLAVFRGHQSMVSGVAFSPDGRLLASVSLDCTGLVWDTSGLAERATR